MNRPIREAVVTGEGGKKGVTIIETISRVRVRRAIVRKGSYMINLGPRSCFRVRALERAD